MSTLQLSKSFIQLVRAVTKNKTNAQPTCEFCFMTVPEVQKYLLDPMVGEVCAKCKSDLDSHQQAEQAAVPKRKQFASAHGAGTPARVKEAGVIGTVHDLIFISEKISLVKLRGALEDKGYKAGTVNAQLARVKKAYLIKDEIVYADQKALDTLEEVRKK